MTAAVIGVVNNGYVLSFVSMLPVLSRLAGEEAEHESPDISQENGSDNSDHYIGDHFRQRQSNLLVNVENLLEEDHTAGFLRPWRRYPKPIAWMMGVARGSLIISAAKGATTIASPRMSAPLAPHMTQAVFR